MSFRTGRSACRLSPTGSGGFILQFFVFPFSRPSFCERGGFLEDTVPFVGVLLVYSEEGRAGPVRAQREEKRQIGLFEYSVTVRYLFAPAACCACAFGW